MDPHSIHICLWSPGNTFEFELEPNMVIAHAPRQTTRMDDEHPVFEAEITMVKNYPTGDGEVVDRVKLTGEQWVDFRDNLNVASFMATIIGSGETGLKAAINKNLMPGAVPAPQYLEDAAKAIRAAGFNAEAVARTTRCSFVNGGLIRSQHIVIDNIEDPDPRFSWSSHAVSVTPIVAQIGAKVVHSRSPSGFSYNINDNGSYRVSMECNTEADAALAVRLFTKPYGPDGTVVGPWGLNRQQLSDAVDQIASSGRARRAGMAHC